MKTALITGAATGIGLSVASKLTKANWTVFATAMPGQDVTELASIVPKDHIIEVDLSQAQSIESLIAVIKKQGKLDALVSNAGLAIPGPIEEVSPNDLEQQFAVNVFAPMRLAQSLLPMLRQSKGRMVFVGAGQGRVALPFGGPYGGSKAALAALTDALRSEVASSGVTVSLIEPGAVKTPILKSSQDRAAALIARMSESSRKLYEKPLNTTLEVSEKAFASAIAPEKIAALVESILAAKKPKPRYLIGKESVALAFIALLPARLRATLVLRTIK